MKIGQVLETMTVEESAKFLLGSCIYRQTESGELLSGKVVETEAYHQLDPASHTYNGLTPRNSPMFGPAGRAYIYFTYGMHYCMNVVARPKGEGAAVLLRALEPLSGLEVMERNRQKTSERELCSGPGKLTQAMGITKVLNNHDLSQPPLWLEKKYYPGNKDIVATTRIGINKAKGMNLRFYLANSRFISKK